MYRLWILWLHRVLQSPPLRVTKTIAARLWRESNSQGRALLRHRAIRCIWLFLLTSLSRTKDLTTFCVTTVRITLRFFADYLAYRVVPAATKIFRRMEICSIQFSTGVAAGLVKWLTEKKPLHRPAMLTQRLLPPAGLKPRMTTPILRCCGLGLATIRQVMAILRSRC